MGTESDPTAMPCPNVRSDLLGVLGTLRQNDRRPGDDGPRRKTEGDGEDNDAGCLDPTEAQHPGQEPRRGEKVEAPEFVA